ncbi:MAG: diphosphomevalonate/mevalonate 3,5-bisphosphate decarboxylase family protein [Flavobacteriaceae bacterium]
MKESDFILPKYEPTIEKGKLSWRAASNIALIKYWGKKGRQIPANPSLSLSLESCATTTTLGYTPLENSANNFSYDLVFENKPNLDFRPKIDEFLLRIEPFLPFLKRFHFEIDTFNSFPHSSGIASSASAFAALSLCLLDMERQMNKSMEDDFFYKKASFLARLGSGSASRSIQGPLMQWGHQSGIKGSTDLYAIPYPNEVHPVFETYRDVILLVDRGSKTVSSTLGHSLMQGHVYSEQRFEQAQSNIVKLKEVLKKGDLDGFIEIIESEALSLHAMMMTSIPYFILMKPNTVAIIQKVWDYRLQSGLHLGFTLDAGANVHLLFPEKEETEIYKFINEELVEYCEQGEILKDKAGSGSRKLS